MNYSIIGIDFGTSTTVVKVRNYIDGEVEDCKTIMFNGSHTIPTLIFKTENDNLKFGKDAENCVANNEKGSLYDNFKMQLLDPSKMEETRYLILNFFKHLYLNYNEQKEGLNVQDNVSTIISFPAKWIPENRTLMKECAQEVGFPNVDGLDEPTAAIRRSLVPRTRDLSSKGYLLPNHKYNVFLIDMGAGTTDIAIFTLKAEGNHANIDKIVTYPRADAPHLCGGREIDKILQDFLYDYLLDMFNGNETTVKKMVENTLAIKSWKENSVSPMLQKTQPVVMPANIITLIQMFDGLGVPHKDKDFKIQRSEFESLTFEHWKQWDDLVKDSLLAAQQEIPSIKGAESIDFVIATGGHSLWYGVRDYFLGNSYGSITPPNFAKLKNDEIRFIQESQPQETVAEGLTYDDSVATINPVFGNSLWAKVDLEGSEGTFEQVLSASDPIPTTTGQKLEFNISSHLFRLKDICFTFTTAYGSQIETAIMQKKVVKVQIPDAISNYIIGIILGGPIAAAKFLIQATFQGWEKAFAGIANLFENTFKLKLNIIFNVHKDGTVLVRCNYQIDDSSTQDFTISY